MQHHNSKHCLLLWQGPLARRHAQQLWHSVPQRLCTATYCKTTTHITMHTSPSRRRCPEHARGRPAGTRPSCPQRPPRSASGLSPPASRSALSLRAHAGIWPVKSRCKSAQPGRQVGVWPPNMLSDHAGASSAHQSNRNVHADRPGAVSDIKQSVAPSDSLHLYQHLWGGCKHLPPCALPRDLLASAINSCGSIELFLHSCSSGAGDGQL